MYSFLSCVKIRCVFIDVRPLIERSSETLNISHWKKNTDPVLKYLKADLFENCSRQEITSWSKVQQTS